jgi:hypothetical protein
MILDDLSAYRYRKMKSDIAHLAYRPNWKLYGGIRNVLHKFAPFTSDSEWRQL